MKSGILPEPIIVGRQNDLVQLQQYLDSALKGKGSTVLLSGEAGVGKTRLLDEFLKIAKKRKVTVLSGWCLSDAAIPYFPFVEAFDSYSSSDEEGDTAVNQRMGSKSWLVETNQSETNLRLASSTPQVWKDQAFAAVTKELLYLSAKKPLILALEDIHWADSASLSLLHYLARQVSSERILIIASFRSEELNAEEEGYRNPLTNVLLLMGREDLYKKVELSNLGITDVGRIAESMLGDGAQPELVEKIATDSGGNPLFVVESLRLLYQQGNLSKHNGKWSLRVDRFDIPRKVKDVILRRLGQLTSDQREILDVASIVGEKFDPELVADVVSQDSADVIRTLNEISKTTLMVNCEGDCYSFVHAKFREMLYNAMPLLLRRKYHLRIAEKIEAENKGAAELTISDLAYHYVQSGCKTKASKYSLEAGKAALSKFSNEEAIKNFTFVVQAVGENPEQIHEKTVALEGLGDAYCANDNFEQATTIFKQLAATQTGATKLRALRKAAQASFYSGDVPGQRVLIQKAEKIVTADRLEAARVLYLKAEAATTTENDFAASFEGWVKNTSEEALRVFEEEYALWDAAQISVFLGYGQTMLGRLETGVEFALRSISLFEELGDFRSQVEAYSYAGGTFLACMLFEASSYNLAKAVEINEQYKIWAYVRVTPAYIWWSILCLFGGDIANAISKVLKALECNEMTDSKLYAGSIYGVLIMAYAFAEDTAHVDEYYVKLMNLPKHILSNAPTQLNFPAIIATYYAAKKDFEKSNKCFSDGLAATKSNFPSPLLEASRRKLYAWSLSKQGKMAEAKSQLEQVQAIIEAAQKRFSRVNIQPSIMTFSRPNVNQEFPVRLDLVNVSKSQGSIVKVENLVDPGLKIIDVSPNCFLSEGNVEVKDKTIGPFEVKTIRLTVKAAKSQEFHLNPTVTYVDNLGETRTSSTRPFTITVQSTQKEPQAAGKISECPQEGAVEHPVIEFEFATDNARKAFDFLIAAFLEDYMRRKLPAEKSGWRTLMKMIKSTKLSKYSTYGSNGRGGQVISELERQGIVDARVFSGERGRGGRVLKLRVMYEKESVRQQIDSKVLAFRKNR